MYLNVGDRYNHNPDQAKHTSKIKHRHVLFQVFLNQGSVNDPTKKRNKV
jgi:hypothetical protein